MRLNPTRSRIAAAMLAGALLAVPACSDDAEDAAEGAVAADASTSTDSTPDQGESEPETVEVVMVDYGYEGLPAQVPAGTRLTVTNESEVELHEVVAIRLPDGEDRPVEELVELPEPELMGLMGEDGEPVTVLLAAPGGDMIPAVGDGTLTEPGRYLIACFIPTGADPEEYMAASAESEGGPPQVDGGPPHFVQGMFAELLVT